jgi:hypothetical protein
VDFLRKYCEIATWIEKSSKRHYKRASTSVSSLRPTAHRAASSLVIAMGILLSMGLVFGQQHEARVDELVFSLAKRFPFERVVTAQG